MSQNEDQQDPEQSENSFINDDEIDLTPPERHGCVTAWLILMLIANSITFLIYLYKILKGSSLSNVSSNTLIVLMIIGALNVIFSVMLLSWKKNAFYGVGMTAIVTFFVNVSIGISPIMATIGLAGFAILYGILQIKKDGISAWDNMQ